MDLQSQASLLIEPFLLVEPVRWQHLWTFVDPLCQGARGLNDFISGAPISSMTVVAFMVLFPSLPGKVNC